MAEFFGFEINRKGQEKEKPKVSFVPNTDEDGAGVITTGGHFGAYLDLDGDKAKSEVDLIMKYRDIAAQPECDAAVEDIVNEAIVGDHNDVPIDIVLDKVEASDKIKKMIKAEFDTIISLMGFNAYSHDIFRKWYIDGRLPYHIIVKEGNEKQGIQELRYIDPTKLRKVKEIEEEEDPKTGAKLIKKQKEFFIFQDNALGKYNQGLKINPDAIAYGTSGVLDSSRKRILSYLHKAIKPVNQLRMMEDSVVIYRISRAPERRIFYIDVGNLPKGKAEEYLRGIMNQYRNKLVYDAKTGDIKDDKKHMSMLEDFFLPRREGGRGTEISTLPGGQNLGDVEDIEYFKKKLYRSLNVPHSRMESDNGFNMGRASEISRDELKFNKFTKRLQMKFARCFTDLLRTQLVLKNIVSSEEFDKVKDFIHYDFATDNHFTELKEGEIMRERLDLLGQMSEYVGKYYSNEYIRKAVLRQTDADIEKMDSQIEAEGGSEGEEDDLDF